MRRLKSPHLLKMKRTKVNNHLTQIQGARQTTVSANQMTRPLTSKKKTPKTKSKF